MPGISPITEPVLMGNAEGTREQSFVGFKLETRPQDETNGEHRFDFRAVNPGTGEKADVRFNPLMGTDMAGRPALGGGIFYVTMIAKDGTVSPERMMEKTEMAQLSAALKSQDESLSKLLARMAGLRIEDTSNPPMPKPTVSLEDQIKMFVRDLVRKLERLLEALFS